MAQNVACSMNGDCGPPIINLCQPRGDSCEWIIGVAYDDGTPRQLSDGDTIRFVIRASTGSSISLLEKVITDFEPDGTARVVINPEDTKGFTTGKKRYGVELTAPDVGKKTIISPESAYTISADV